MKQQSENKQTTTEHIALDCPIGRLVVSANGNAVCSIRLAKPGEEMSREVVKQPVLLQAIKELSEYFKQTRTSFTFQMQAEGTTFQKQVWQALSEIPFGELRTYGQIALRVNNPKGSRAVGMACNKNPIMIAVPCHRVVGAGGKLVGYAYGTDMKQQLLALEQQSSTR